MTSLFEKRLIFVTGKGGVGKSTVAAALGLMAARRGKRTILCEVAQQERMSRFFHREGVGFEESELEPHLYAISIDPQKSMEEYFKLQVRLGPLNDLLFHNRFFQYFAAATPGLKELLTIGKIWELAQLDRKVKHGAKYDPVIVDAPATGHGLGILKTPKTFANIAKVGPVRKQALAIDSFITNTAVTGIIAVTTPEEMPVNETVYLQEGLRTLLGLELNQILCNGLYPERFKKEEIKLLRDHYESSNGHSAEGTLMRAALEAAASQGRRANAQHQQVLRLKRGTGKPIVKLPFLFKPELGVSEFEELGIELEAQLL